MKESEIRAAAKCAHCGRLFGESGSLLFYRVKIDRFMVNPGALQRQTGLAQMLGSAAIAEVMGTNEDMATKLDDGATFTICHLCSSDPISTEQLQEYSNRPGTKES